MKRILSFAKSFLNLFWFKLNEAVYVTNSQYKLRMLHYSEVNNKFVAVIQVVIKRVKAKLSIQYLASNNKILQEIHPVNACKLAFLANAEGEITLNQIPSFMEVTSISSSIIKQQPALKIIEQSFSSLQQQTIFTITDKNSKHKKTLSGMELAENHELLYALGSQEAARVGISASNDYLKKITNQPDTVSQNKNNPSHYNFRFYHMLCMAYLVLVIAGLCIVRRMFPFQIPFTDIVVPFGGGILFFPIIFCIQDTTTEVYGFAAARQMVILSIFCIFIFFGYTQLAINLPTDVGPIYSDNGAFNTVFNTNLRQIVALIVSLFIGSLINDFFISRSKVILAGQYLWMRLLGSTMIGEAVLQVVGGVIGFSDKLDFKTQLLPNMILAYGYKVLWCAATIPIIYIVCNFLKRMEGIDVYDYDVDYNPFKLGLS